MGNRSSGTRSEWWSSSLSIDQLSQTSKAHSNAAIVFTMNVGTLSCKESTVGGIDIVWVKNLEIWWALAVNSWFICILTAMRQDEKIYCSRFLYKKSKGQQYLCCCPCLEVSECKVNMFCTDIVGPAKVEGAILVFALILGLKFVNEFRLFHLFR